jgi:hypothetical protein
MDGQRKDGNIIWRHNGIRGSDKECKVSYNYECLLCVYVCVCMYVIIIIFLHGLGRLTCSGIDSLPSFRIHVCVYVCVCIYIYIYIYIYI